MKTLQTVTPTPGQTATLTTTTGRAVAALKTDRVIFAPDRAALIVGAHVFHVPAHLFDDVRRALALQAVTA